MLLHDIADTIISLRNDVITSVASYRMLRFEGRTLQCDVTNMMMSAPSDIITLATSRGMSLL